MTKLTRGLSLLLWIPTALLASLTPWPAGAADHSKPVAVLSIASVDHLMSDFAYLTEVLGRSDVGGFVQMAGMSFVQDLDRTKPLGVLITIEDDEPKGVGFLAVPDLKKALQVVREKFNADVDDLGDGIQKLNLGQGAYLKQQGEWVYFSDHPRHLENLPPDPAAMLGGLDKQYSVAVRLFVQNIPQNLRDLGLFQLHAKIDSDARSAKLDDPEIDGPFLELLQNGLKTSANALVNESDQITLGWALDSQRGQTFLDVQATAVPGSALANQLSLLSNHRSILSGFVIGDAATTLQGGACVSPQSAEYVQAVLDYLRKKSLRGIDRDPNAPEAIKDIVTGVLDVIERTVKEGRTEIGASVVLAPNSFQFVAAARVADGRALADAFQKLFELARQQPDVPDVKFYADKHRRHRLPHAHRSDLRTRCRNTQGAGGRIGCGHRYRASVSVFRLGEGQRQVAQTSNRQVRRGWRADGSASAPARGGQAADRLPVEPRPVGGEAAKNGRDHGSRCAAETAFH